MGLLVEHSSVQCDMLATAVAVNTISRVRIGPPDDQRVLGSTFDGYHSSAHPPLAGTNAFGMLRFGDSERIGPRRCSGSDFEPKGPGCNPRRRRSCCRRRWRRSRPECLRGADSSKIQTIRASSSLLNIAPRKYVCVRTAAQADHREAML